MFVKFKRWQIEINGVLILLVSLVWSALIFSECSRKPIVGKWELVYQEFEKMIQKEGRTIEFFKDGTVSIDEKLACQYSFPDKRHLKLQCGEGGGIIYEYSLSGDKLILKSGERIRVYMRYKEITPSPESIAGIWYVQESVYGGYYKGHKCLKDLGVDYEIHAEIRFGEDGSFSFENFLPWPKYSLAGKFSINGRNLHISASGTCQNLSWSFGFEEKEIGGESVCQIELLTNTKLVLKDNEGNRLILIRPLDL